MERRPSKNISEWLLSLPSFSWLSLFFLLPTLLVTAIAFRPATADGGIGGGWTLKNVSVLFTAHTGFLAWRSFWISTAATLICLLLALPCAYQIARCGPAWRRILLLLVVVPFWTNFLVRVFAWKALLHPEGPLKRLALAFGLVRPEATLLYHPGAVLLVTVYAFLPFAILPIYAAAEKFDVQLSEAARDLGASRWQSFRRVFLPAIRRGLLTAALVVFIPALGSYVIPDLVGGPTSEMIGNKIAQRVFVDRNLPQAGALSLALILAVVAPLLAVLFLQPRRSPAAGKGA